MKIILKTCMSNEYFFDLYPIPEPWNFGAIMVYLTRTEFNETRIFRNSDIGILEMKCPVKDP